MKTTLFTCVLALAATACATKKQTVDPNTLPKDISLKPDNQTGQVADAQRLAAVRTELENLVNQPCTSEKNWRTAPVGAKACGGPAFYIAYPIAKEEAALNLIKRYTEMQAAFNAKYQIMSDCAMVMPPAGIQCINGKVSLRSSEGI